jgi:two-component system, chemotaxis family, protein-glutamate methylesterase/glutaminase
MHRGGLILLGRSITRVITEICPISEGGTLVLISFLRYSAHGRITKLAMKNKFPLAEAPTIEQLEQFGMRSTETCPKCGGALWEISTSALMEFRCCAGHVFTGDVLLQERNMQTAQAIWAAARAVHEKQALLTRLAAEARERNRIDQADEYEVAASAASRQGEMLRQLVSKLENG